MLNVTFATGIGPEMTLAAFFGGLFPRRWKSEQTEGRDRAAEQ